MGHSCSKGPRFQSRPPCSQLLRIKIPFLRRLIPRERGWRGDSTGILDMASGSLRCGQWFPVLWPVVSCTVASGLHHVTHPETARGRFLKTGAHLLQALSPVSLLFGYKSPPSPAMTMQQLKISTAAEAEPVMDISTPHRISAWPLVPPCMHALSHHSTSFDTPRNLDKLLETAKRKVEYYSSSLTSGHMLHAFVK